MMSGPRAGSFRGKISGDLRTVELIGFHERLTRLYESLKGTAEFEALEEWLTIHVIGDGKGHLRFDCEIMDEPGIGNTHRCNFEYDQTFLPPILVQLGQALHQYPIIGFDDA